VLEEDDSLASESTSKKDKDSARLERLSVLGGLDRLACLVAKLVIRFDRAHHFGA